MESLMHADDLQMIPKQNVRSIRRPSRVVAEGCDLSFEPFTAEGRNHAQATTALGAICDVLAVGRPVRLPIAPGPFCHLNGIAAGNLLHPNVELPAAVRTVSDIPAI